MTGALFSPDRLYRYTLWRRWARGRVCNFVMLNPSTADEVNNDPTVERCERRARQWGYGALVVTNIFAYRSTDPAALRRVADPVGPANDDWLAEVATRCALAVCAWGTHGKLYGRGPAVRALFQDAGVKLRCLKLTAAGHPQHPLYLPYTLTPRAW